MTPSSGRTAGNRPAGRDVGVFIRNRRSQGRRPPPVRSYRSRSRDGRGRRWHGLRSPGGRRVGRPDPPAREALGKHAGRRKPERGWIVGVRRLKPSRLQASRRRIPSGRRSGGSRTRLPPDIDVGKPVDHRDPEGRSAPGPSTVPRRRSACAELSSPATSWTEVSPERPRLGGPLPPPASFGRTTAPGITGSKSRGAS